MTKEEVWAHFCQQTGRCSADTTLYDVEMPTLIGPAALYTQAREYYLADDSWQEVDVEDFVRSSEVGARAYLQITTDYYLGRRFAKVAILTC